MVNRDTKGQPRIGHGDHQNEYPDIGQAPPERLSGMEQSYWANFWTNSPDHVQNSESDATGYFWQPNTLKAN